MQPSETLQALKSGAKINDALSVVTENYGACKANADRLTGLQEWVREL